MTRLLAPQDFGVMAIVNVVLIGLAMLSDLGLGPSVIRSPRIADELFLNTAWTMQIVRAVALQVICIALAYPAALFYEEPRLTYLLPVAAFSMVVSAFAPMQIYTLQRSLMLGKLVSSELISQAIALAAMASIGYFFRSIWVLVIGGSVAAIARAIIQWVTLPAHTHSFRLVKDDVKELLGFGGWIFISSLLAFGANSAGSLVLGKLASMEKVGLFAIASTLAKVSEQFYEQLSSRVLFPMYADFNQIEAHQVHSRIFKIRLTLVAGFVPIMCIAAYFARPIFRLLFDHRYQSGFWIFQVIVLGIVPSIISSTLPYLMALGKSRLAASFSLFRFVGHLSLILLGYLLAGDDGAILGIAALPILVYFLDYYIQRVNGFSDFRVDAIAWSIWLTTVGLIFHQNG